MKRVYVFLVVALLLLPTLALAADPPGGVKVDEVLRRGNTVEHIDGYQAGPESPVFEALQPPASDADKWFVTVLTTPNCSGCKQLLRDWKQNQWLLALADPDDPAKSWAHFFAYDTSDRSQGFRAKALKVTTFPTVIVQPPRTGKYGDPATVVFQQAYQGDPRKLAEGINSAIRLYVEKLSGVCEGGYQQVPWKPRDDTSGEDAESDPDDRRPLFPFLNPDRELTIPPVDVNFPAIPWTSLISALLSGAWPVAIVIAVIWGFKAWRAWRKSKGEKLLISDDIIDNLSSRILDRIAPDEPDEPEVKAKKTTRKTTRKTARRK